MHVLVTGAGGLIGGEVASRLARRGHSVSGLVHRCRDIVGNDGVAVPGLRMLDGDVTLDRFGWDKARWRAEAARHDVLIHCAAAVKFGLAEDAYREVNIEGTRRALALARESGMAFCYVSTAYVSGLACGPILETCNSNTGSFANLYEASKAAAECLVRGSGLVHAIARPSIVVGESMHGVIRRFDNTYGLFRLIANGNIRVLPAMPDAVLDLVPIDHVTRGIVALAEAMALADGGAFHLVSGAPLSVIELADIIGSFPQFFRPALAIPEAFDLARLRPAERSLYDSLTRHYSGYFQRAPHFQDEKFRELTGLSCPLAGTALLRRLIQYAIAQGFLRAADAA